MCSGRIDLEHILRAFSNGQDGVYIGGCRLNECNYVTHGNYDALGNTLLVKKILAHIGLNPKRLRIEFMNASDGIYLAETINDFTDGIYELGPIGESEGMDKKIVRFKLDAVRKLVPYIRLVERERLRAPKTSEAAYRSFYDSEEVDRLFHDLVLDKVAVSQIMMLLQDKPLSTGEIADTLNLNPSEVSKHMKTSSRFGLVKYDESRKCYMVA